MINCYDIWFSNLDISNNSKLKLLEKFEKTEIIWALNRLELKNEKFKDTTIDKILDNKNKINLDKYAEYMEKNKIDLVLSSSNRYPNSLKNINNPPAFLYIRGNIENIYIDSVAIVGSRNSSSYGKFVARKIAKDIADRNVNIVSGLAVGIDKYAHIGALESKFGKTIAVLGTGISNSDMYPIENLKLFEKILEFDGTIVSEFKLGTKAQKYNFPIRNRIISGLAQKIIIVEAKEKSGSMITVDYALEQGKEVFAVPGNITSSNSIGTNKLIAEGANIFTKVEDIFY